MTGWGGMVTALVAGRTVMAVQNRDMIFMHQSRRKYFSKYVLESKLTLKNFITVPGERGSTMSQMKDKKFSVHKNIALYG